jgi:hypothetical protein
METNLDNLDSKNFGQGEGEIGYPGIKITNQNKNLKNLDIPPKNFMFKENATTVFITLKKL